MADQTPATITPSVLNTTKNGATSPQQGTTQPAPASAAADPLADREAKLAAREAALEKRDKVWRDEAAKNSAEKKGLGAKLSEHAELKKWKAEREAKDQMRRLNPVAAMEEDYGKDWREKLTAMSVNGVPPQDLIAAEIQKMRSEWKADLEAERAKTREQTTSAEAESIEETRAMVAHNASEFYGANAAEYPVFEKLGDPKRIGAILGQRIEQEFLRTGKMLTPKEAADGLDAEMFGIVETAVEHEKYKQRLQAKTKAATVTPSSGPSGAPQSTARRTLSNDLTASTPGRAPPRSDEERTQRAIAAFNAARTKGNA